jgi:lysozyme family protein
MGFDDAINLTMRFEVGAWFDPNHPACVSGSIKTAADRRATGYVNDPDDSGGETKFGVAKNANPDLDIDSLTFAAAKRIYFKKYWLAGDCADLPEKIALAHFDACVHHGIGRAAKMLQEAVGATIDGDIGPKTIQAVRSANEAVVLAKMLEIRRRFFREIVKNRPTNGKFLNGWMIRVDTIQRILK